MFSLFQLLLKNFKILLRSKTATAAIFFGPILLVLLLGAAFNTAQLHGLELATYSSQYNELTDSVITKLSAQFSITKAASAESCIEGVKVNEWHVCFIFPNDFSVSGDNKIDFYVNPTHINLVQTIINLISVKVEETTGEIRVSLIETIMERANSIEAGLTESDKEIASLKAKVLQVSTSLQSSTQTLSQLDFDLSFEEFNITRLKTSLSTIKSEKSEIEDEAESINESSVRETIQDACHRLNNAVNNATNTASQLEITAAKAVTKLGQASQATAQTKQALSSITSELSQMTTQLVELDKMVGEMTLHAKNIKTLSASQIAQPITTSINQVIPKKSYLELILPLLIALLLLFGGIFLGSSLIISEKKSRAYFRNFILPINKGMFVLSTYLTAIIVLMLQVILLFALLAFVMTPQCSWALFLAIFLIGSIFILLGMVIGYLSRTAETSVLITMIVILFILFFSNLVLPIETIAYLKELAFYNPLTIATNLIKSMSLLGLTDFAYHTDKFITLGAYIAGLFIFSLILQEFGKRHV